MTSWLSLTWPGGKPAWCWLTIIVVGCFPVWLWPATAQAQARSPMPPEIAAESPAGLKSHINHPSQLLPEAIAKWEPAIRALEARDAASPRTKQGILFLGSSSIRRWKTLEQDMAPWLCINRGYGGAKLIDLNHYLPRLLKAHVGPANPQACRAIVVFVANDISGGTRPDPPPEQVVARFQTMLSIIRKQAPRVPVLWIEVTPTERRWHVWPQIEEASRGIRGFLKHDKQTHWIATAGAFLGSNGKPDATLFVNDRLHLNEDGYRVWSKLIKAKLHAELGPATATTNQPSVPASGTSSKPSKPFESTIDQARTS